MWRGVGFAAAFTASVLAVACAATSNAGSSGGGDAAASVADAASAPACLAANAPATATCAAPGAVACTQPGAAAICCQPSYPYACPATGLCYASSQQAVRACGNDAGASSCVACGDASPAGVGTGTGSSSGGGSGTWGGCKSPGDTCDHDFLCCGYEVGSYCNNGACCGAAGVLCGSGPDCCSGNCSSAGHCY